jgi:hypothetical protein
VPHEVLRRVLLDEDDPQVAAGRLVDLANEAGGPDNVTAVVLDLVSRRESKISDRDGETLMSPAPRVETTAPLSSPGPEQTTETVPSPAPRRRRAGLSPIAAGIILVIGAVSGIWFLRHQAGQEQFASELRRVQLLVEDGRLAEARSALLLLAEEHPDDARIADLERRLQIDEAAEQNRVAASNPEPEPEPEAGSITDTTDIAPVLGTQPVGSNP